LERRLIEVMREQFEHELERSVERIREAIAPYTRFVRTQTERLNRYDADLKAIASDLRAIRHDVGGDREEEAAPAPRPAVPALPATTTESRVSDGAAQSTNGAHQPVIGPGTDSSRRE
jgi:hypothetical protein